MTAWRKICCAIDFSDASRAAFEQAVALAVQLGAEMLLVHVVHATGEGVIFAPPGPQRHPETHGHQELQAWTREAQERAHGLATSVELSGDPATEIARFADGFGCDVIVMGTHGGTGLRHAVVGSVAEGVLRVARCPVLVVRRPDAG
jgi:universal stress protein A